MFLLLFRNTITLWCKCAPNLIQRLVITCEAKQSRTTFCGKYELAQGGPATLGTLVHLQLTFTETCPHRGVKQASLPISQKNSEDTLSPPLQKHAYLFCLPELRAGLANLDWIGNNLGTQGTAKMSY